MYSLNKFNQIFIYRAINILLIGVLLIAPLRRVRAEADLQTNTALEKAQSLLDQLSPEERVGQLFLVTFKGQDVSGDTAIYNLIVNHHVGGVILQAANDNFTAGEDSLNKILSLNRQIQLNRWSASQRQNIDPQTGETLTPAFIPMFVGISQEGDGYPYDQILEGLTPLPNEMAIGATWNPDLASQVGQVLGKELSTLGINLLLGPSLDVLETPLPGNASDLGTRTFGGDPFWVGEMGLAYIEGVHQGGEGKVALIAKHFPGNGGADRPPEEEVATVRKSFEQLKNFDLVPFFTVTGDALQTQSQVDGLLAAHIRYQGFQENIRVTTRPVSFDPQAFNMLMSLPPLETWRQAGGIIISDNLASQAVRRFYDLTGQDYDLHRVALNAFLAGNDIVYIGDVGNNNGDTDPAETIINTLENFTQKYREDPAFAQRVDESVLRILTLKYRIYSSFVLGDILPDPGEVGQVGNSQQINFEVARQGATIISPSIEELDDAAPDPPNFSDRIIFFTDERQAKQCSTCPEKSLLPVDALESAVIRLYGPQAGGQVLPNYLDSFSFHDLERFLDDEGDNEFLSNSLTRAHWVVFSMLNITSEVPESNALRRFLSERPDLLQQKRLVVFAFNGPYFLDATNISKITAYYGLYSKTPQFVDVAARLLFREMRPTGALPVSVPGIGYDLISATSPNPDQVIPLLLDDQSEISGDVSTTPTPAPTPDFRVGDFISLRTGVIVDHNGHRVPDGTPVQFIITLGGEVTSLPEKETTMDGVARTTIQISNPGLMEIRAESEPAKQSQVLRFDIPPLANGAAPVTVTPTQAPTHTPSPTSQATNATPIETVQPESNPPGRPNLFDWFAAILITGLIGLVFYRLAVMLGRVRWGVRGGLFIVICGLLGYSYLAFSMPGSEQMFEDIGSWAVLIATSSGALGGILLTWVWMALNKESADELT
jgi:beta-N-acetylhexosaminidase